MATATKPRRKSSRKPTGAKVDPYQLITDRIVASLEAGVVPWHKPWDARLSGPRSLSTGKPYSGVNVFTLLLTAQASGYSSNWWGTYRQIAERGGQVKKGEHGTPVVFWKVIEVDDEKAKDGKKKIFMLRHFSVFNADQAEAAEGKEFRLPAPAAIVDADYVEPVAAADAAVAAYLAAGGPTVKHGGDAAAYSPSRDHVMMPLTSQFHSTEGYYTTLLHELGHSTGHASRLNRDGVTDPAAKFGSGVYGKEELVAEMTAAFVTAAVGIEQAPETHAGYLGSWLRTIQGDPKMVVQAAGAAQKAANLILGQTAEDAAAAAETASEGSEGAS